MIKGEGIIFRIFITVVYILGILCSGWIFFTYQKFKKLQQNPGRLIQLIFLLQILMSSLMILSQFYVDNGQAQTPYSFQMPEGYCTFFGVLQGLIALPYTFLNAFLIFNVFALTTLPRYDYGIMMLLYASLTCMATFAIVFVGLLNGEIGMSYLGDCYIKSASSLQKVLSIMSLILLFLLGFILLYMTINFKRLGVRTVVYNYEVSHFNRKYAAQFLKSTIIYGTMFIIVRIIPEFTIFIVESKSLPSYFSQVHLASLTFGGLLLALLRSLEPIFCQYLLRQVQNITTDPESGQLEELHQQPLLIQQEESNVLESQAIDIEGKAIVLVYEQDQNQTIVVEESVDDDLLMVPDLVLQMTSVAQQPELNENFNILAHLDSQQIGQILQLSALMIRKEKYLWEEKLLPFLFNKKIYKEFTVSQRDGTAVLKERGGAGLQLDPNVRAIECLSYGPIMASLVEQYFLVSIEQIIGSLDWKRNQHRLQEMPVQGTILITYNDLISVEIVSKEQKKHLTQGGGLLQLWRAWVNEVQCNRGLMLPVIVALQTFIFDAFSISLLLKLNRVGITYPLINSSWKEKEMLNMMVSKNIIGWVTVSGGKVVRRFMAKEIKYKSHLVKLQKDWSKIDGDEKQHLIEMLKEEWEIMKSMRSSCCLQFVFHMYPQEHLNLHLANRREGKSIVYYQNRDLSLSDQHSFIFGQVYNFQIKSRIGYVKVYWDDFCIIQQQRQDSGSHEIEQVIDAIKDNF